MLPKLKCHRFSDRWLFTKGQSLLNVGAAQEEIDNVMAVEEQLIYQFLITSQTISSESSRLEERAALRAHETHDFADLLSLILIIILAITVVITSVFTARSIKKPLSALVQSNKDIAAGKYKLQQQNHQNQQNQHQQPKDELGEVMRTRNIMLKKLMDNEKELRKLPQKLEKEVKQRTKELEASRNELQKRVSELERWRKVTVGRELRLKELKREISEFKHSRKDKKHGQDQNWGI